MHRLRIAQRLSALALAVAVAGPGAVRADAVDLPTREEVEDAVPVGESLTGREIWEKFLDNKMHAAVQHQTIVSRDPGGGEQQTRFWVRWKDYRDENLDAVDGVLAKTLIKFMDPFDMRHTGFLMIVREDRGHDQFVYQPSRRKVRRVKLNEISVMGTDFTFGDIAYQDIEDADYLRHPDEEIDGIPVYVVEANVKPLVRAQHVKTISYLEKEHYVPLRARYWDRAGVEIKELTTDPDSIQEFDGIWLPKVSTMRNLQEGTSSTVIIEKLDANPEIAEHLFSVFRLSLRR